MFQLKKIENKQFHHSLQLSVDDYMQFKENFCIFTHKGAIGLGNFGSGKISTLIENYVKPIYPKILTDDKKIFLGKLPNNELWHLNDEDVIIFFENLISYAIVRDKYRDDVKREAGLE